MQVEFHASKFTLASLVRQGKRGEASVLYTRNREKRGQSEREREREREHGEQEFAIQNKIT